MEVGITADRNIMFVAEGTEGTLIKIKRFYIPLNSTNQNDGALDILQKACNEGKKVTLLFERVLGTICFTSIQLDSLQAKIVDTY